ncbi:lipid-binding SYLF domain-containing protein [Cerasicoccus arenae]|uniref:Ysc84 actin-binding domain-containing protein n=1 Tax=Cerasicoccus arenae TaxID=424488 RepID=A0A8J3DJK1_9BACT|nr:lipid-binding SYLF domain-containing protein [Cerasicoccus arenae]MBK1858741.1 lipid-binding SYLF domain-containing protein [Cerasicoccus arenae]GHC07245.1 hypothetical protein GCM10007047_25380 [Cerasicoccus arenae]
MKMKSISAILISTSLLALSLSAKNPGGPKPDAMNELIIKCRSSFELLQASEKPIPAFVIQEAEGLAIATVTRGGIGIGGQKGKGFVITKTEGGWSAPSSFDTGGGSIGLQLGVETVQYVFVLNTKTAIEQFVGNEVSLDAKASATAGPDHAAAANDKMPKSDIYIYSISDGAFAGATIGGVYVSVDTDLNNLVYSNLFTPNQILSGEVPAPSLMDTFYSQLNSIVEGE